MTAIPADQYARRLTAQYHARLAEERRAKEEWEFRLEVAVKYWGLMDALGSVMVGQDFTLWHCFHAHREPDSCYEAKIYYEPLNRLPTSDDIDLVAHYAMCRLLDHRRNKLQKLICKLVGYSWVDIHDGKAHIYADLLEEHGHMADAELLRDAFERPYTRVHSALQRRSDCFQRDLVIA